MAIRPYHPTLYSKLYKDSPIACRIKSKHLGLTRPLPIVPASSPATFCLTPYAPSILAFVTSEHKSWLLTQGLCTGHFCMAGFFQHFDQNVTSSKRPPLTTHYKVAIPPYSGTLSSTWPCLIFFTTHITEMILSIFSCLLSVHPHSHGHS